MGMWMTQETKKVIFLILALVECEFWVWAEVQIRRANHTVNNET